MFKFKRNEKIAAYTVVFPINEGAYAETYRVKDARGILYFLKLICCAKLRPSQMTDDGKIIEIEISKLLNHKNTCKFVAEGTLMLDGQQFSYFVTKFVSGETVAQKVIREQRCSVYDAKNVVLAVLEALRYLHTSTTPILHNEITIQNLMLDFNGGQPTMKLIDFGHARFLNRPPSKPDLCEYNLFYLAPERFNGFSCIQSDLYSVGVMLYHMLFGLTPWFVDLSKLTTNEKVEKVLSERRKPLKIPNMDLYDLDEQLISIMIKSTAQNVDDRFQTADEFIKALHGEIRLVRKEVKEEIKKSTTIHPMGNGFKDVAGMEELKEKLQIDIIKVLKDPERAKQFGITIPNGILLYGPPGCGKTFFAEKLAEEIGCNYMYVKCSDVASPYIHGGQEKIAAVFNEARDNAPTLLFLDEVEAMITDRSKHNNVSEAGEVNEFLAQLNNCGQDGVTVIGATNKPDVIDEAALRSGRLAFHYYVPQPSFEARKQLFEINLKNRAVDLGIDYDKLATMTENYSCSDIKEIVDNAGRIAFGSDSDCITQTMLETACANLKSHLTLDAIRKHEAIRDKFEREDKMQGRTPIGFKK